MPSGEDISNCCSEEQPCQEGTGDCDRDSECENGLRCGVDNCQTEFADEKSNWKPYDDCCTGNKTRY